MRERVSQKARKNEKQIWRNREEEKHQKPSKKDAKEEEDRRKG